MELLQLSNVCIFKYGNLKTDWVFYEEEAKVDLVKSSNVVYLERKLAESFVSNYHQGWMSQEDQLEAFNKTQTESFYVS